ncbi:BglG family transcription antiterminator [Neobacillus cucumis]|uniref:Sugar transporter n=1 Tax=Neobacillus cucumis TaxID=1740721 RepID=A0A2N5HXX5_9BACI|nr:BglG family transcription antiterminator [Neobacillus cucumis]PLS10370.1 sugar transporter [Neobacillus cucumis]
MYITTREKAIIELLVKTSGKHTVSSLANHLNVSVRTVHRDLTGVEKILKSFDLHLVRQMESGLRIEGKNENIFRLVQNVTSIVPIDQTPEEKKLLLLIALMQEEAFKIQSLAMELGVSNTTLTTYLGELTEWLSHFNVTISRKRGVGVDLIGSEAAKRKALASYFLLFFNEELIESLFLLENNKYAQESILHYFFPEYIVVIDRLVNTIFDSTQQRLADNDYIGLIVHIGITMQRTESSYFLEEEEGSNHSLTNEYNLIKNICAELEKTFSITFTEQDIIYLAVILKGSKLQAVDVVPYDSLVLSKIVKTLIQEVSLQLHVDLTNDFSLYQGLLAHMEPSLYRIKQQMGLFNPLKEEIKQKYPFLFLAVKNSVEKQFAEIDSIPDDEIAFIVLHFGSALVMREEKLSIHALVVCPTGIGTSKMLASRIKKEILGIDHIEIKSIKEIQDQTNVKNYDLIISTVKLPFLDVDYLLVSPLLTEQNITAIKNYLRNNLTSLTEKREYIPLSGTNVSSSEAAQSGSIYDVIQQLKIVQESIEDILLNFKVYKMDRVKDHENVLAEMVITAQSEKLLDSARDVLTSLSERESKGGLGIPGTGMGLFHCRDKNVHKLIFQISHLHEPIMVKGMDGNDMLIKNILLLLAPEELSMREQEIVSLISTSLIENSEAMMIFSSSNEEVIRRKLENIFLHYLQTKIIKE